MAVVVTVAVAFAVVMAVVVAVVVVVVVVVVVTLGPPRLPYGDLHVVVVVFLGRDVSFHPRHQVLAVIMVVVVVVVVGSWSTTMTTVTTVVVVVVVVVVGGGPLPLAAGTRGLVLEELAPRDAEPLAREHRPRPRAPARDAQRGRERQQ